MKKKLLEVIQDESGRISFDTDFDAVNDNDGIIKIIGAMGLTMMTTLTGDKEAAVVAIIRALALSDLGVSINRRALIRSLDKDSAFFARIFRKSLRILTARRPIPPEGALIIKPAKFSS